MTKEKPTSQIRKERKKKKKGLFWKLFKWLFILFIICSIACVGFLAGVYFHLSKDLPKITSLKDYHPSIITTVYSDDDRKIGEFYNERRIVVPAARMPRMLKNAFIAAEDSRFYKHKGLDFIGIFRAMIKNIEAGAIVQGGSTITQQVTKSFFLTPERTYHRKIKEAILAHRIDKALTKQEILNLYLNQIYLGNGAYGVQAASENYFGKSVDELNLAECAILAGLPQAPSRYSPFRFPERAKSRQIYVLNQMVAEGFITNLEATEAINTKLDIKPRKNWYIEKAPYFTEHIRRYVEKKYGKKALYENGLKIYSTVNLEMQDIAREEISRGLRALDKRQGYRGPVEHLEPEEIETFSKVLKSSLDSKDLRPDQTVKGIVIGVDSAEKKVVVRIGSEIGVILLKSMKWARKPNPEVAYYQDQLRDPKDALTVGDVIWVKTKTYNNQDSQWELTLEQEPGTQAALLLLEVETGYIKAMIGGRDFKQSKFNRAIQSRRQPGSAFKPIIYAAALDYGYTPATVIIDSPVVYKDEERDFVWKPKNYEKKFYGPTILREALSKSRNIITIKILQDIGIQYAIDYAKKLGIVSPISPNLSIALGSSGVSMLELVNAYSVFANLGYLVTPSFIRRIEDRNGNVIEEPNPIREKVIESSTAYIMTHLLQGVVEHGTGRRIRALKRKVAGKTGTTNNLFDAWFIGYTPSYVTAVWVGYDKARSLGRGETGSRAASPIWLGFMKRILEGKPVRAFQVPEGVVFAKIDAETGYLPIPESKKVTFECFKEGTVPEKYTKPPDIVTKENIFKLGF